MTGEPGCDAGVLLHGSDSSVCQLALSFTLSLWRAASPFQLISIIGCDDQMNLEN